MNICKHILLVEDDPDVADAVCARLRAEGYTVECAPDGAVGARWVERRPWDAVVLHLALPHDDGPGLTRRMRSMERYTPIIATSAHVSEVHRIVALEMGADDYLARPFSLPELVARLKALLRRSDALERNARLESASLQIDGLFIDPQAREVKVCGKVVALTPLGFDLLHFLARNPGRVFSRLDLLHQVWGYRHGGYEHTVNTHINRLRIKVETHPTEPRRILTVWGRGYKLATPPATAALS